MGAAPARAAPHPRGRARGATAMTLRPVRQVLAVSDLAERAADGGQTSPGLVLIELAASRQVTARMRLEPPSESAIAISPGLWSASAEQMRCYCNVVRRYYVT